MVNTLRSEYIEVCMAHTLGCDFLTSRQVLGCWLKCGGPTALGCAFPTSGCMGTEVYLSHSVVGTGVCPIHWCAFGVISHFRVIIGV